MRYRVLATDYDGTLATEGAVEPATWAAVDRFRAAGGVVVLVTGRELGELRRACPPLEKFDRVVAENGGLLHRPGDRSDRPLGPSPPPGFVEALVARGVGPISVGRVIVATWEPHRDAIEATIRDLGLGRDLRVIPNKRALMILPAGVDKASGLALALAELGLAPGQAVGVGDAENDLPLLESTALGVAVANAQGPVKERAGLVTRLERGAGVAELIGRMLADDLPGAGPT